MPAEPELTPKERELLDFHLRANTQIFATLTSKGFDFAAPIAVDFHCTGSDLHDIADLAKHLKEQYQYEAAVYEQRSGEDISYTIEGRRPDVILSQDFMDRWCRNMVVICGDFGCCFGGWGVRH